MTPDEALKSAIKIVGSQAALAKLLGITQPAVAQWRGVPPVHVLNVERATGGQVSRHDLRPDIYPREDTP